MDRIASIRRRRSGMVMVVAMIFIVIFSALALSLAITSGTNAEIAVNQIRADQARTCAESGLQVLRYWFSRVVISGRIPTNERLEQLASAFQTELTDQEITNLVPSYESGQLVIPSVSLNSEANERFAATITQVDANTLQVDVTGSHGEIERTVRVQYAFQVRANTAFDFGVATKGPLTLSGNVEVEGVNLAVESNAYIESLDDPIGLTMSGKSEIAGDVKIVNHLATPDVGSNSSVGGEKGAEALDHIQIGVSPSTFPEMAPEIFYSYATNVLTPSVNLKKAVTLENILIPAGMNPKFSAQANLKGVVLIEAPNVVDFTGGVSITGIIVTNGDPTDDSGTNQIIFRGHVAGLSVAQLPAEPQFAGLNSQTGTFVIAPGFFVSFGGTFDSVGGAIAANGVEFFGNAGGVIQGSVINYANKEMKLWGNSSLLFNRSGLDKVPAGFVPQLFLNYQAYTYSEPVL